MKAIILAGGMGMRLSGVVKDVPKPMAPIAGKPFLEYLVLQLIKWKIRDIIFSIGYKGDIIKSYFDNGKKWGVRIVYSEEDKPLGTGGALRKAMRLMNDEQFIVMNGDSFLDLDFNKIISYHQSRQVRATIGLLFVNDISRYGKVELNNNGKIIKFAEKGGRGPGLINGGVYIFNREIINNIPAGKVSLENEVLPNLIHFGLYGMVMRGYFVDIGIPRDYLLLCKSPRKLLSAIRV